MKNWFFVTAFIGGVLLLLPTVSKPPGPRPDVPVDAVLEKALSEDRSDKISTLRDISEKLKNGTAEERVSEWAKQQKAAYDRIWSPVADVVAAALHNGTGKDLADLWEKQR